MNAIAPAPTVELNSHLVHVTVVRALDGQRHGFTVEPGQTLQQIVETAMPLAGPPVLERTSVRIVSMKGVARFEQPNWRRVRPYAGTHVVIRVTPAGPMIGPIIQLVAAAAAKAVGGALGGAIFGVGSLGQAIFTYALTMAGGLLVNMLLKPKQRQNETEEKPTFVLSGMRNELRPDAPVPLILGKIRYAPPYAAPNYTEIVGDIAYLRAKLLWGYGPIELTDIKIGDTPIDTYDELTIQTQLGEEGDPELTLYPRQVFEENAGADLKNEPPRDDYGEIIDGEPSVAKPVNRWTASDVSEIGAIFYFPAGLFSTDGEDRDPASVHATIEQRPAGSAGAFSTVREIEFRAKKPSPFFRAETWAPPVRGAWEVKFTRTNREDLSLEDPDTLQLFALQSIRPEYPINFDKPIAVSDIRIRATAQLNGSLDSVNGVAFSKVAVFSGGAWNTIATSRNCAALAVHVLRGNHWARPQPNSKIDWAFFEDWYQFCVDEGLEYNRPIDFDCDLDELLREIGAAGRAALWEDGERWTGVIDRVRMIVTDHVNSRNSSNFQWGAFYFERPDAYRVRFQDETADYIEAERIIPWPADVRYALRAELEADLNHPENWIGEVYDDPTPGNNRQYRKTGAKGTGGWSPKSFDVTEDIELPGKTHPDQVWIEARRLQYERIHRNVWYKATQPGSIRVVAPGDFVLLSRDVMLRRAHSGRVTAVKGKRIALDEAFTMEAGQDYAVRFRVFASDIDAMGTSVYRTVKTVAGKHKALTLTGEGETPAAGALIHFGPAGQESIEAIVTGIDRGKDNASIIQMVPAANIIHELVAAEVPPAWSSRVGSEIGDIALEPGVPVVTFVRSGIAGTGNADWLEVGLAPAEGEAAALSKFEIQHRLTGAPDWDPTPADASASGGMVRLTSYVSGDPVEWQPRAVSSSGIEGDWGTTRLNVIGSDDLLVPPALDEATILVTGALGRAAIAINVASDIENTTHVQIYHNTTGVAPDEDDALWAPIAIAAGATLARTHGDNTRVNLLAGVTPTLGTNWTAGSGTASHAAGAGGSLVWNGLSIAPGDVLRSAIAINSISGGSLTPRNSGSTTEAWATVYTTAGLKLQSHTAVAANTAWGLLAATATVCQVNTATAVLFKQTAACIASGDHHYWFRPINDGVPGPLSSAFTVTVS